ncbi:diacylglycerol/lipid kinase family protein [Pedobacter sandarakinus]|uniref:diacylglycerol/lipid kinase family protein n=1 Tax=Pedobacter sandarakinus TaxID=353156 RepID=UPI0022477DCA|nr:diacylglycerol kinase family protein [Pedobacter sandarakinus]MCX2575862.1 diacylglycerol kinase family protein [Pedobacter sandarakinus]
MKKADKLVRLIHNPSAGEGNYGKKEIIKIMKKHGYTCSYASSEKKSLKDIAPETQFIAIAGGDGTIRKTIMNLLTKQLKFKRPIALLPFGTANNIATSLGINEDVSKNVSTWDDYKLRNFDVGQALGLKKAAYFIEALGFGLFPKLITTLTKLDTDHIETAEEEFELALKTLLEITRNYPAVSCKLLLDGKLVEKKCLLVEVMNISRLGPNLKLSEKADPGDGFFDVVIIEESKRKVMEKYIEEIAKGKKPAFPIKPVLAKEIKISWKGKDFHIDDEIINQHKPYELTIGIMHRLIEVIVNKDALV